MRGTGHSHNVPRVPYEFAAFIQEEASLEMSMGHLPVKEALPTGVIRPTTPGRRCRLCGATRPLSRLPFAVGRQDSPPFPRQYRLLAVGPRRMKFIQRYRWVWHSLFLCKKCTQDPPSEKLWNAIQSHPQARVLLDKGYSETRLDPNFSGEDGAITSSEEPL